MILLGSAVMYKIAAVHNIEPTDSAEFDCFTVVIH
jgi:hypothetical protein